VDSRLETGQVKSIKESPDIEWKGEVHRTTTTIIQGRIRHPERDKKQGRDGYKAAAMQAKKKLEKSLAREPNCRDRDRTKKGIVGIDEEQDGT